MLVRVRLERIEDNPFQTRQVYDEAGIGELAADIQGLRERRQETMGLIQVPLGRLVVRLARYDPPERVLDPGQMGGVEAALVEMPTAMVQLAAGHNRLRAFRLLNADEENGADWASMPVDVDVLDDQAMADIAWSENAKRKDLTAIEEGAAIKRAMDDFGYSLAEVSQRWGLSRSAASNKVRLLELPEKVQELVRSGELGERHARELLPLVQVGRSAKAAVEAARDAVKFGTVAAHVAKDVERRMTSLTRFIEKGMLEWDDWGEQLQGGIIQGTGCVVRCRGCEHETRGRCARVGWYEAKRAVWMGRVMAAAERKSGLKDVVGNWRRELGAAELGRARERKCEFLGLSWRWSPGKSAVLVDAGLPFVYFVCGKEDGDCQECRADRDDLEKGRREVTWRDEQQAKARKIGVELFEDVLARVRAGLEWIYDDDLGVFGALAQKLGDCDGGGREEIARVLADWLTGTRHTRYREGSAMVYRAQVLGMVGVMGPEQEMQGWLQVLRDEREAARLGGRGVAAWKLDQAKREMDVLLTRQPNDEIRGEFGRLLEEIGQVGSRE